MKIKLFNELTSDSILVREEVFIREQGFIEEFDDTDKIACHLVAFDGDKPVGTCRFFFNKYRQSWIIGNIFMQKMVMYPLENCFMMNTVCTHG